MPKVSVIVPIFNVAKYLRKCLDSVLAQTLEEWEAICVDDGSTDSSGEIAEEYAKKDSRIKVCHQSNQGLSIARRTGFVHTKGEFIVFIDSDDWIDNMHLEKLYACVDSNGLDYVSCNITEEMDSDVVIKDQSIGGDDAITFLASILTRKIRGSVCTGIYRRAAVTASGTRFVERHECPIMEDTFFNAQFFVKNPKIGHIKDPSYHYLIHGGTLSGFDGKDINWWHKAIRANESIISTLAGRFDDSILNYRAAMLKSWLMWAEEVPQQMFTNYHPEIHWLPSSMCSFKGNIQFYLATLGLRDALIKCRRIVSKE